MRQQDLVWVNFPYSNLTASKIRPGVIVSSDAYNQESQEVIICAITSNLQNAKYSVLINKENLQEGSMPIRSRVRADKIVRIQKSLVAEKFARLNNKTFDKLIAEINSLIKRS